MATASFDKSFVIKDKTAASKFRKELSKEHVVLVKKIDVEETTKKGIELLKQLSFA